MKNLRTLITTVDPVLIGLMVIVSLMGISFLWYSRRVARRFQELEKQVGSNVTPFWATVQTKLIADLTHPHPAAERVDELLERLKANATLEMTPEDRQELLEGLERRAAGDDPKISEEERRKAAIMPLVMEEVQKEAANPDPITDVQLVGFKGGQKIEADPESKPES